MTELYKNVNGQRIKLTPEEVESRQAEEAAWLAAQPTAEQKAQIETIQAQAEAAFDAMPKGKKSLLKGVREDVRAAILMGDFAEAREIIETAPLIYEGADVDKAAFLAMLPSE